ncbi:MAG: DUF2914 domain-containing protein [bacterium]|nr:DUF2914 domain-containing protein [bacterium]MDO8742556.1 DUF2914 domain-containing protein [bacterium]
MLQKVLALTQKYERHFSALAMVLGFISDTIFFGRVDLWETQLVFALYTAVCFITIPLLHWLEARGKSSAFWSVVLSVVTQFALGGFWSGFVIFYGRSANFGASWPFLLFLALVLLGTEYFRHYHSRLVFTSVLFFFALYSYAIFAVPVYTGSIGVMTFLLSGVLAVAVFAGFVMLLRTVARERFLDDVWRIRAGALLVLVLMNVFYFTNILPPLPLSAEVSGVYHSVTRTPGAYVAQSETGQSWKVRYLGFPPTLHITSGEILSAYSSVFAPTTLATSIVHRWQWHDPVRDAWVTKAIITYSIVGGRDGGYRGYSNALIDKDGEWRVNIETIDGRLLTRLPFTVEIGTTTPEVKTFILE